MMCAHGTEHALRNVHGIWTLHVAHSKHKQTVFSPAAAPVLAERLLSLSGETPVIGHLFSHLSGDITYLQQTGSKVTECDTGPNFGPLSPQHAFETVARLCFRLM